MPTLILFLLSFFSLDFSMAQSGFITGKVYSQVSKTTLSNAKLILKKNNKYCGKTKTDHVGNYWFGDLNTGTYSVWVVQEGYVQLEMGQIEIKNHTSIQLDLGLMETAENTNVATSSKMYLTYQEPIDIDLEAVSAYEDFKNEIHIINEVYDGNEIRIAPKERPQNNRNNNRSTHYYDSLKALEKTSSILPAGI